MELVAIFLDILGYILDLLEILNLAAVSVLDLLHDLGAFNCSRRA